MKKTFFIPLIIILIGLFLQTTFVYAQDFTDVPQDHAYYDAIMYVRDANIVSGYDDNTFRADQPINRAEFVKIIINATFDQDEIDECTTSSFDDVPVSEWYAKYICVAVQHNIAKGYDDGLFHPEDNINFAEGAKIIVLSFDYEIDTTDVENWYEPYVTALTDRKAVGYGIDGLDVNIERQDMAEMIYRLKNNITDEQARTYYELANPSRSFMVTIAAMDNNDTSAEGTGSINLEGKKMTFYSFSINNFKNQIVSAYLINQNTGKKIYDISNFNIDENYLAYATGKSLSTTANTEISDTDYQAFKDDKVAIIITTDKYPDGELTGVFSDWYH